MIFEAGKEQLLNQSTLGSISQLVLINPKIERQVKMRFIPCFEYNRCFGLFVILVYTPFPSFCPVYTSYSATIINHTVRKVAG